LWGFLFVLSLVPIGLLAYRTYGLARATYWLEPDRLIVQWGARREIIPLSDVKEALAGKDIQADLKPRGLWWPGCLVGRLETADLGEIEFLATMPQDDQVFVVAAGTTFALSPVSVEEFTAALAERREALSELAGPEPESDGEAESLEAQPIESQGPAENGGGPIVDEAVVAEGGDVHQRQSIRPAFETWEIWQDRWALGLLLVSVLAVTLLFAFVLLRLPSLPVTMPLHFSADGLGTPDRSGGPHGLLILPLIGLLTLAVNCVLGGALYIGARQRAAAYLLLGSAAFVQLLVWVATLGLMARV
jgi:hypothetical protein